MKQLLYITIFCLLAPMGAMAQPPVSWEYTSGSLRFHWDPVADKATLTDTVTHAVTWQGGLLPSFWVKDAAGQHRYLKPEVSKAMQLDNGNKLVLSLELAAAGNGQLIIERAPWGMRFSELQFTWHDKAPEIIEMYIGASALPANAANVKPVWDRPFMPDWQTMGYCVPGAKAGTVQSYFRMWDFGQPDIALGNFGPSMSTPYGAAFPRPVLFTAMGAGKGWLNIGAGSIPDAAMTLSIRATRGCFRYLYREDLWGAPTGNTRTWQDLLRITIDTTALGAFEKYYTSFPVIKKESIPAATSVWNTWGMWRLKKYPIRPIADFMQQMGNEMMVLDDPWESSQGSGEPDLKRFPAFYEDIAYIRKKGVKIGIWETLGWIKDTLACKLGTQDLIVDSNGKPCMANWNFDPSGDAYYCLDVSSPRARAFLQERTRRVMQSIKPQLIKLDFGYGLPSPDMGAPRDPQFRGERQSFELVSLIAAAAKSVDKNVIIMYYGISPLWAPVMDMVSLDDQGDLWYDTRQGHQEWSIWASLLSRQGIAVSGSSSYSWTTDDEVLMNTIILGSPGAVLGTELDNGAPIPEQYLNKRWAVNKWYRRTVLWTPCWLNSHTGDLEQPPHLRCWGREETIAGNKILTALTLREDSNKDLKGTPAENIRWSGNWGLISQDDRPVTASGKLAIIPFSAGHLSLPYHNKPKKITRQNIHGASAAVNWTWKNKVLNITVTEEAFRDTAGFLVEAE
ncbi:hypothetical protein [Chitinophaga sp. MM2321]|uniref:hypothetical protein n=1 Tax=Chitinophaga sp. MM2321 TaxID=3137178 RepID=UPI0032D5A7E9